MTSVPVAPETASDPTPANQPTVSGPNEADGPARQRQPLVSQFDPSPLYKQAAAVLRERIASGRYPAGRELPTAQALAGELSICTRTVGAAINLLVHEGLVERHKGYPARVRGSRRRERVPLQAGDLVDARMPTPSERAAGKIDQGVPVFVVGQRILPADRVILVVRRPGAAARSGR